MQRVESPAQDLVSGRPPGHRKAIVVLAGLAVVAWATIAVSFYRQSAQQESSAQWAASVLDPMAVLLAEDQEIIRELQYTHSGDKGNGLLESYLTNIRSTGVPGNAQMKQRLDQLAENNAAIVALIEVYAPHARTAAFRTASDSFRTYAAAWRDRWNSVMETFMAGGNYAAAGLPFPAEIVGALTDEASATR